MKLKYTEVKSYRSEQLVQQDHRCALCGEVIVDDAVLDHDHKTGLIRRVLHRGCNALLGKIENNLPRNRVSIDQLAVIAQRLIEYITIEHTDILHPSHKTPEERKALAKKRRKSRQKRKE